MDEQEDKFKLRKEACKRWQEYKQIIQATRNWVRKTKTLTELNLDRNVKDNQNFNRHISDQRKICLLQKETWRTKIGRGLRYSMTFFTLVLNGKCTNHATQGTEGKGRYERIKSCLL